MEGRKAREDELDRAISEWTAEIEDAEAFQILQRAGVPCGLSLDMGRLHAEPQLNEGGYLKPIDGVSRRYGARPSDAALAVRRKP